MLSTNIMGTGVTLPEVNVVMNTGRVKQIAFNERKRNQSLIERFVSKASVRVPRFSPHEIITESTLKKIKHRRHNVQEGWKGHEGRCYRHNTHGRNV